MKILYVHGFGSCFQPESNKMQILKKKYELVGIDYDYSQSPKENLEILNRFAIEEDVDMVIGTSLGGWYAAQIGFDLGIPSVSINPASNPQESLMKYVGQGTDHKGREYTMEPSVPNLYWKIQTGGYGLVLIDEGDEVIDPDGINKIENNFEIVSFNGGSHRFEHMEESLQTIDRFYDGAFVYGSL